MKKEYINPQTIVVRVQAQAILADSYIPFAEEEQPTYDGSQAASRRHYNVWGDDE